MSRAGKILRSWGTTPFWPSFEVVVMLLLMADFARWRGSTLVLMIVLVLSVCLLGGCLVVGAQQSLVFDRGLLGGCWSLLGFAQHSFLRYLVARRLLVQLLLVSCLGSWCLAVGTQ